MHLENLQLVNFKNYEELEVNFSSKINVLVGKNGSGKTNLLDAIYYLSFTKSSVTTSDTHAIRNGADVFLLKGNFRMDSSTQQVSCSVGSGTKKIVREGTNEYQKLSDHIGKYPVVLIAPDDTDIIRESSDARRRFFDGVIAQIDKIYLDNLMRYNHILKQRNSLLRMFHESGRPDWTALEAFDEFLVPLGKGIYERRKTFVSAFLPVFKHFYDFLVEDNEITGIEYKSGLSDVPFQEALVSGRHKDLALQRTTSGIHRDEYRFLFKQGDLRHLGSQGQQKSFVIALKLAQLELIKTHKGFTPILLLDDVFDKLDDLRIGKLLDLFKADLGQLFITDARPDRTQGLLRHVNLSASTYIVKNGNAQLA